MWTTVPRRTNVELIIEAVGALGQATTSYYAPASAGTYSYSASFLGNASYAPAASTVTVTVSPRPTSLAVAVSRISPVGAVRGATWGSRSDTTC